MSQYHHPNRYLTWSMWGIFAVNDTLHPDVYTVRPHYYVFKQLYHFVRPGYQQIDMSTTLTGITVSAFLDPKNGKLVITGKNDRNNARSIYGILKNLSKVSKLRYYYTDSLNNFSRGNDVMVTNQNFSTLIAPSCVFTLVSM